jgi:metal-responsive CopG/Arc/MetJ family transcriptional regulator
MMQLNAQFAQKISVSLDPCSLGFVDRYAATHAAKGRSAVIAQALKLLQKMEQENELSAAYAASFSQDAEVTAQFDAALLDGLTADGSHAAW